MRKNFVYLWLIITSQQAQSSANDGPLGTGLVAHFDIETATVQCLYRSRFI
jgi:hypothetical protein